MTYLAYVDCLDEQVNYGGHDDPRELLKYGWFYKVKNREVHDWFTQIELEDFPGKQFNSVCFRDVDMSKTKHLKLEASDGSFNSACGKEGSFAEGKTWKEVIDNSNCLECMEKKMEWNKAEIAKERSRRVSQFGKWTPVPPCSYRETDP